MYWIEGKGWSLSCLDLMFSGMHLDRGCDGGPIWHLDCRIPLINGQCQSMPIKILELIQMPMNSDQFPSIPRHLDHPHSQPILTQILVNVWL